MQEDGVILYERRKVREWLRDGMTVISYVCKAREREVYLHKR